MEFYVLTFETRYSHNEAMKKVKVSELKTKLSSYQTEVRNGDTVIVCDRKTPIAQLIPFDANAEGLQIQEASRPIAELFGEPGRSFTQKVNVDKILGRLTANDDRICRH